VTSKDLAVAFATGAGHPNVPVEFVPWDEKMKIFDLNVWMDTTKIEKAIGWKAHHNGMIFLILFFYYYYFFGKRRIIFLIN
jgi:hypothetical protein